MVERVEWNGWKYRRYPDGKASDAYFRRSVPGGCRYLHRDVWESAHGEIQPGFHVHHIDGNTANNSLGNLEAIGVIDHCSRHPWSNDRVQRQSEHLERIRHLTKDWHASPAGRAKHVEIGGLSYAGFVSAPKPCSQCGLEFKPNKIGNLDKFCSNRCKSAHRRASGIDDETRICAECGASFAVNRYSGTKACSRSCANRARSRTIQAGL